jgi:hypothetical protein
MRQAIVDLVEFLSTHTETISTTAKIVKVTPSQPW